MGCSGRCPWLAAVLLAGACGGGGDDALSYAPVSATSAGDLFTLKLGDVKMVVDASTGARITEFSLRGTNALVTEEENLNYGATFWPSPQSSWCATGLDCFPPPEAIDAGPYTGSIDDANSIQLASAEASIPTIPGSAIAVTKRLTPRPENGAVDVTYTLTNTSPSVSVSLAAWQVSRVASGGLSFFAQTEEPVTYAPDSDPLFIATEYYGVRWYTGAPVRHNSKLFADGNGWLGHVTPERLLTLQSYPDFPPGGAAPGEAEIEIFTNSSYVEIEAQGALTPLAPGSTLTWTVRWKLRRLPADAKVAVADPDLMSFVFTTIAEQPVAVGRPL